MEEGVECGACEWAKFDLWAGRGPASCHNRVPGARARHPRAARRAERSVPLQMARGAPGRDPLTPTPHADRAECGPREWPASPGRVSPAMRRLWPQRARLLPGPDMPRVKPACVRRVSIGTYYPHDSPQSTAHHTAQRKLWKLRRTPWSCRHSSALEIVFHSFGKSRREWFQLALLIGIQKVSAPFRLWWVNSAVIQHQSFRRKMCIGRCSDFTIRDAEKIVTNRIGKDYVPLCSI